MSIPDYLLAALPHPIAGELMAIIEEREVTRADVDRLIMTAAGMGEPLSDQVAEMLRAAAKR